MRSPTRIILGAMAPLLIVVAYASWTSGTPSPFYPPVRDIAERFLDLWVFERVGTDVIPSLRNLAIGLALAVVAGVASGLLLGWFAWMRLLFLPLVTFGRSIPPITLIPPLVLVLGIEDGSKIAIIAFGCAFPICLATIDGMRQTDPALVDVSRSMGLRDLAILRRVYIPSAMPSIFGGLQVALQLALVLMVASEMVAAYRGLGYVTMQAQLSFDARTVWAGIVLLALIGFALHLLFLAVRRRALGWHIGLRALSSSK
jgi:sulfonate transport system permease protein